MNDINVLRIWQLKIGFFINELKSGREKRMALISLKIRGELFQKKVQRRITVFILSVEARRIRRNING